MITKDNISILLKNKKYWRSAEKTLCSFIKKKNFYKSSESDLIEIEIKQVSTDMFYINNKMFCKICGFYKTTLLIVYEKDVFIFHRFSDKITKEILDFFTSKAYKRKIKLKLINESINRNTYL